MSKPCHSLVREFKKTEMLDLGSQAPGSEACGTNSGSQSGRHTETGGDRHDGTSSAKERFVERTAQPDGCPIEYFEKVGAGNVDDIY